MDDNEFKTALVESGSNNREVFFSFCNDSEIPCSNPIDDPGSALIRDKDSQVCTRITSPSWEDATVTYVKNDLDRTRDHLRLSWEGRDPCPADATRNLGFAIDLVCTDAETQDDVRFFYTGGLQDDSCQVRTAFESKLGCAIVSYREIAEWLSDNYIVFGAILIVLGFFLLFFGYRLILVALFLATVLVTVLAAGVIAFQVVLQKDTEQYVLWVILGVAFIIG